jgi:glycosyltransferase involved in cell wall biosynthesis
MASNTETPTISVIIPVFNSEIFLQETLNSLINQTFIGWECLIIDDGSTDSSLKISKKQQEKDSRIHLIRRTTEIKGAASCRNIGLKAAIGKYIIFLDSDDLLLPHCLEQRVKHMNNNPDLDFAVFQAEKFGLSTEVMTEISSDYLSDFLTFNIPWQTTGPIWKTSFLMMLNGFNPKIYRLEDPELHIRALLASNNFDVLPKTEPDYKYRLWRAQDSISDINFTKLIEGFMNYINSVYSEKQIREKYNKTLSIALSLQASFLHIPCIQEEITTLDSTIKSIKKMGLLSSSKYFFVHILHAAYKASPKFANKYLRALIIATLSYSQFKKTYFNLK